MIPRRNKISAANFPRSGTMSFRTPSVTVKMKLNAAGILRVGVIVSASVLRSAVRRNFWKRRLYDMLFCLAPRGYDILVIAGPRVKDRDPKILEVELAPIFKKLPSP